jgi:hypothetical protein
MARWPRYELALTQTTAVCEEHGEAWRTMRSTQERKFYRIPILPSNQRSLETQMISLLQPRSLGMNWLIRHLRPLIRCELKTTRSRPLEGGNTPSGPTHGQGACPWTIPMPRNRHCSGFVTGQRTQHVLRQAVLAQKSTYREAQGDRAHRKGELCLLVCVL